VAYKEILEACAGPEVGAAVREAMDGLFANDLPLLEKRA